MKKPLLDKTLSLERQRKMKGLGCVTLKDGTMIYLNSDAPKNKNLMEYIRENQIQSDTQANSKKFDLRKSLENATKEVNKMDINEPRLLMPKKREKKD